ncbi:MAG TPA: type IV conjugative transfer system protein TraL [Holosporales bacterium]|nr:type IV conjugative transfer system protein TraL [Holosporales bacterium]
MDKQETLLLNRLDQPLRFLGINKDEAFTFLVPLVGGLYMGWVLSGSCLGIGALLGLRSLKKQNEGASLIHAMYWYLPTTKRTLKLLVYSHIREYNG